MPRTCIRDPLIRLSERSTRTDAGCLEWTGARDKNGYGVTSHPSGITRAHRLAWFLRYGEIPEGMVVCHSCDNPPCIDIDHLWLGTHGDNATDRDAKGRRQKPGGRRGESHPKARLTEDQVLAIRTDKRKHQDIANAYGVNRGTIRGIKYRQTWKWLDG